MKKVFALLYCFLAVSANAGIIYNSDSLQWTLTSGNSILVLSHTNNVIKIVRWGITGTAGSVNKVSYNLYENKAVIAGVKTNSYDYEFVEYQIKKHQNNIEELILFLKNKYLPIHLKTVYRVYDNTGVMSRQAGITNVGNNVIQVQHFPSLAMDMLPGKYSLLTLPSYWGNERNLTAEALPVAGHRVFATNRGTSTSEFASWFCLQKDDSPTKYLVQLAYSGNWQMSFLTERDYWKYGHKSSLSVEMGMLFDHHSFMELKPGRTFINPEVVFTTSDNSLDEAANQMHQYQRRFVVPVSEANRPLLVVYNSWYGFPLRVDVGKMKKTAELAAKAGCELFMLDAGWYNTTDDWTADLGNWYPVKQSFPKGIEELANYVRSKGMKFGIWTEIENAGKNAAVLSEHPEWFFQLHNKPLNVGGRYMLNFANREAWLWAFNSLQRLITNYQLDYLKIDYNVCPGNEFDPYKQKGLTLYNHLMAYYNLLDTIRQLHPRLIIENCASGAMRQDIGIMAHTNTSWVSDDIDSKHQPQLAWAATLEFIPEICNYFVTGDTTINYQWLFKNNSQNPGWNDYIFRISMIGQYGISSDLTRWPEQVMNCAVRNVELYKKIRTIIAGASVYHLTPMPDHFNPQNWSVLQYVNETTQNMVILAARLKTDQSEFILKPEKVNPDISYLVYHESGSKSKLSGKQMLENGITISLQNEFNSTIIRIEPEK